ncbi:MAG: cell division protein ZapA (FtsZ GTPase activity inhibitor) [Alphaproteobacteria bacterium]|jgi:cell division protein ZapA (FtsZ GTPase activity inhibitor)
MAKQVEIKIGKKSYRLQSEEGQETRVKNVAELWDSYVSNLMVSAPKMERDQLIVLAGMMMADDFLTARQTKETHQQSTEAFHNTLAERLEKLVD